MPPFVLPNSTYLDTASWGTLATAVPGTGAPAAGVTLNVALVLDRANDPTALLQSNWATRQAAIADQATIWKTYGADHAKYQDAVDVINGLGLSILDLSPPAGSTPQYITSEASRTIWVQVNETQFNTLFGQQLMQQGTGTDAWYYWNDSLSIDPRLAADGVTGVWFDKPLKAFPGVLKTPPDPQSLDQGWQSPGNAAQISMGLSKVTLPPQDIAQAFYNFPLVGKTVATGTIGLIEPGVGTALPFPPLPAPAPDFATGLDNYRTAVGLPTGVNVVTVAPGGQAYPNVTPPAFNPAGERSMDFGVVTAIAPSSTLVAYAGSGQSNSATANPYTAYQAAFWDTVNNPAVITSSFSLGEQTAQGSPFLWATRELFIDAALRGITMFNDNGDMGSGAAFANGIANVNTSHSPPYAVMVGGTSVSSQQVAAQDSTLNDWLANAVNHDPATLWQLVAGGMTQMPQAGALSPALLLEAVWNQYYVQGNVITNLRTGTGYFHDNTASSGIDTSQAIPDYQQAFGLKPKTSNPSPATGRGTPDVAADAGGNLWYTSPTPDLTGSVQSGDGTSAATPLWAGLATQINAIFADQGLPKLGYMNDLLYTAAAIAPASFNDITIGSSTSSFFLGGTEYQTHNAAGVLINVVPTGHGYAAKDGYDLVTGLGTPNGTILARAMTWIAQSQTSYDSTPAVLESDGHGGWKSGADQSLLVQSSYGSAGTIGIDIGGVDHALASRGAMTFAWTSRMAGQSLQADFDPALVRLFDHQSQGDIWQFQAGQGAAISVSADGTSGHASQAGLTSSFGFADYFANSGAVRLAQAVAVAETVGAANDQVAIVRVRQGGQNDLAVTFYRVDDQTGKIGGLAPGAAGYAEAAQARSYQLTEGGAIVLGPGYGNYKEGHLAHVNAGDLVAMKLANQTTGATYWAFAQANADGVQHLWNYGANTWGWEDTRGGGDRDYNDMVVQIDFTSAYGHGWIA